LDEETQFKAVLKKSVAMFNMLTGKKMTEREGRAFIEIFDMAEGYLKTVVPDAAETFDVLSQVTYEGPTDEENRERLRQMVENLPRFTERRAGVDDYGNRIDNTAIEKSPPEDSLHEKCGCPWGSCTCTNEMLAEAARKHDINPLVMQGVVELVVDDAHREAEIEAAWQSREIEQAEEADRIESNLRAAKAKNSFDTDRRDDHREGFDYQIVALCRLGVRTNSIIRCFATMPSPAEFWELYRKYEERTHWCFINEWNPHKGWLSILEPYMLEHAVALRNLRGTIPPKSVKVSKGDAPRALNLIKIAETGWERPEFAWCISRKDGFTQYQDTEPTRVELVKASTTTYVATKRKRPEIYLGN
jgi:hypothetical protein